ncbi:MAG: DNA primase catalytic subunit PriS [Methanomassiliicoccales archaeon]|nr:DNA primase catalytic subunit PriS [Methanomassiliicoccales archaeon]
MSGELEFVMKWFRKYYADSPPPPPNRFGRREFGFMFFDKTFVQRHLAFPKASDLNAFLRERVPAHVYYSSAYYELPAAATMEEKKWLGADLIFDLDADHIKGAGGLSYTDMLAKVKSEMTRLLDDFILGDLGFNPNDIRVVFSGGRGYHVHVFDPRVLGLKSHERREIVDYITGTDLDFDWVFEEKAFEKRQFKQVTRVSKARLIPSTASGGWRRRMRIGVGRLLDSLEGLSAQDVRARFTDAKDAPDKLVEEMLNDLFSRRGGRRGRDIMLGNDTFEVFSSQRGQLLFLRMLEGSVKDDLEGQVDEPVTSDIKRLIRLPRSLHGKTGLEVVPMSRSELDEFDPLRDAVPDLLPDDPVKVVVDAKADIRLRGERFSLQGATEVPTFAAVFLVCRRMATMPG